MTEFFNSLSQFNDFGILFLRLSVGVIFLVHGKAKLAAGTPANFRILGITEILAALVIILGFGAFSQIAALWLAIVMVGAIYFKKIKWHTPFAAMDKTGWEFDLILLAANLMIFFAGSGIFALTPLEIL